MKPSVRSLGIGLMALVLILAGAAPSAAEDRAAPGLSVNDPWEKVNRKLFAVNETLDDWVIRPTAIFYRDRVPDDVKDGIGNVLNNLHEPVVIANDLLQGEMDRAKVISARFALNTTIGILGIRDVATEMGYPGHDEDFGQTLAVWGVPEGPYMVLPLIGPSNPRDATGLVVDLLLDPFALFTLATDQGVLLTARGVVSGIDKRADLLAPLDDVKRSSLDVYAALRDLYRQNRAVEIRNAKPDDTPPPGKKSEEPGSDFDFDAPAPGDE